MSRPNDMYVALSVNIWSNKCSYNRDVGAHFR